MELQVGGWKRDSDVYKALVSPEDYEKASKFRWIANKDSNKHTTYAYCRTNETGKIHLHRLIMGLGPYSTDPRIVNHINGNGLDNRRENLEICDHRYNSQSFRGRRNFGVVYHDTSGKRIKKYKACVVIEGVRHQQRFESEEAANQWLNSLHP